jgi:5-methylcytosine-specific restriction endonuclease McrA
MPMEKARYPANWKEIALEVKNAAGWRCAGCGMKCREPGEKFDTHKRTLTVHHIDHRPENSSRENLIALCSGCHLRADAAFHAERRKKRKEQ